MIRFNPRFKLIWKYTFAKGHPLEFKENFPFLVTEKNSHKISLIYHELIAELIENPENYETSTIALMMEKRYHWFQVQGEFNSTSFSTRWISNPHLLMPDRWIKGIGADEHLEDIFVFLLFSAGARNCIG